MITSLLTTLFLGAWVGIQVLACKSSDPEPTTPPCTEGDTITDLDYIITQDQTNKDDDYAVPTTVYVETMVAIDEDLYEKIGKSYKNGRWSSSFNNPHTDEEVFLYIRKFMSAVNIKFQGQFKNPKIKFIIREAFKTKTYIFILGDPIKSLPLFGIYGSN